MRIGHLYVLSSPTPTRVFLCYYESDWHTHVRLAEGDIVFVLDLITIDYNHMYRLYVPRFHDTFLVSQSMWDFSFDRGEVREVC